MRHGIAGRKLGRTSSHRKALFANLATSLIKHGQIRTTLPKAKDLRKVVEPLITLGKRGDLAARRQAAQTITEPEVVRHLFDNVAPAMKNRAGGYTRVLKAGFRQGDAAEMAIIELTDKPATAFDSAPVVSTTKAAPKAAAKEASAPAKKTAAATKETSAKKPAVKKAVPKAKKAEKE